MSELEELYKRNINLLKQSGVDYKEVEHELVLDYETAAQVRKRFGLTGSESKNLFLRVKNKGFCMLITLEGKRADLNVIKQALGAKISIAGPEELTEQTGCMPNCAVPFGHKKEITLIVDQEVFNQNKFIYSPGPPQRTIEIEGASIKKLLAAMDNPIIYI